MGIIAKKYIILISIILILGICAFFLIFHQNLPCSLRGGIMKPLGGMPPDQLYCIIEYPDGGKPCTDSKDCRGKCIIHIEDAKEGEQVTGFCAGQSDFNGCYCGVVNGIAEDCMCVM
jgi:hypothetical protein